MKKAGVVLGIVIAVTLTMSGCLTKTQNDNNIENNFNSTSDVDHSTIDEPIQPTNSGTIKTQDEMEQDKTSEQDTVINSEPSNSNELIVKQIIEQIKNMTLEEKNGQMLIVGFKGSEINSEVINMIQKYNVGGIILFRSNVKNSSQLLGLINSLKNTNSKNKSPLFISVDEEGGRISRMPDELHKIPSSLDIGLKNNSDFSYEIGKVLAAEVKAFGFNMNFAPVLDIFSNPQNTVIGDRAFGADAGIVSELGVQTMRGIREGGIIPVVKHFPGHGDTAVDSHVALPFVNHDMERLESFEFKPFNDAIENKADAVMIAHIILNNIDAKNPASLSKVIITDILRGQMNFDGVVITDDMTMGAIEKNYNIGDAVVKSVNAGSDIILVCHGYDNQVSAINSLKAAVNDGKIPEDRLNESVYRILLLKSKYKLTDERIVSINVDEINKKIDAVLVK